MEISPVQFDWFGCEAYQIKGNEIFHQSLTELGNYTRRLETKPNNVNSKKGAKNKIENYRGICIQSVIVKLFDNLLTSKIETHLETIIHENQNGFRKNRSTLSNLLELDTHVASNLKNGEQTDIIYIDLAKAFDRVDHLILAKKLCALFCPLNLFKTIINFITNRRYVLMIEGAKTN